MKNSYKIVIGLVAVLAIVGLAWNKTRQNDTVKIVALYPLTGGVASWGESSQKATQMAVDEINATGGINGKKLEVIYEDHACDAKTALSEFQQFVATTKIFTSSSCSGTVLGIAPQLQKNDAVLFATIVASTKISSSSPLLFRNWAVETRQANIVGDKMKAKGFTTIGILNETTDFGKGLAIGIQNNLQGSGISISNESFATGDTDVRTQLAKLKAAGVQALFLAPQSETSAEVILTQMEQLNFTPKLFVNDIILGAPKLIANHTKALEGSLGGNFVIQSDAFQNFQDAYKARYGTDCVHSTGCAIAYDTMHILADAIKTNGNTAEGVASYLQTVHYQGTTGATSFDANHDRSGVGYQLSEITGGKVILVK